MEIDDRVRTLVSSGDADAAATAAIEAFGPAVLGYCLVTAGAYRVRIVHPELGAREAAVQVTPGARTRWTADFLAER